MAQEAMKVAAELDAVDLTIQRANYESLRAKHPNWLIYGSETSSTRPGPTTILKENGSVATKKTATMNNQTGTTVGWVDSNRLGPLTVIMPAMQDNLSDWYGTISV